MAATSLPGTDRTRRTREQLAVVDDAIVQLLADWSPMTVRQVYYRVVSLGLAPKTENGYRLVQRECLKLRRSGGIGYSAIADSTRWQRKPNTYRGAQAALYDAIRSYRRALWDTQDVIVEVWVEKDALAGVLMEITGPFDVPLMVSRGFSSETYLYEAGEYIVSKGKPAHVIIMTDFDDAGLGIARDVTRKLPEFLPKGWPIEIKRIAVTDAQIDALGLLSRDPKPRDIKAGMSRCVELDAIEPATLNQMLQDEIVSHLDVAEYNRTLQIEEAEIAKLNEIAEYLPRMLADVA